MSHQDHYRGRLTIPARAPPLVRQFYALVNREQATLEEVESRSGVNRFTMRGWRRNSQPVLPNFEAAVNALGYELVIRKRVEP